MSMFATKSIEVLKRTSATGEHSLKRVLGPLNLVTLGIGAMVGAGISSSPARRPPRQFRQSSSRWCWPDSRARIGHAEFATRAVPIAGSAYTYGYATLGEFFA